MNTPKIKPQIKRRYNLCYRARRKDYRISTPEKTMYRGEVVDEQIERKLNEYGFHVQYLLFSEK